MNDYHHYPNLLSQMNVDMALHIFQFGRIKDTIFGP